MAVLLKRRVRRNSSELLSCADVDAGRGGPLGIGLVEVEAGEKDRDRHG